MEVSSHAIEQQRVAALVFAGGIFSNITHDHLDYHKTFDAYIKAKKKFFDNLPKDAFAVTNIDDKRGKVMLQNCKARKFTYSLTSMADFRAKVKDDSLEGLQMEVDGIDTWFQLIGDFNAYNLLAVYAASILLGEEKEQVLQELSAVKPAKGRFDRVGLPENKTGIIDYAHTPDALENVLKTINNIRKKQNELITIVGCGGDRDATKRPVMAKTAYQLSNKLIITSDNPRFENPDQIIQDMLTGLSKEEQSDTLVIPDRREAIKKALQLSKPNNIILIAGKGHENYQEIKGVRHHFDDKEVLLEFTN
jgi:UDP-N-acetylmuramoyl-L-alanyl-D-glutamate--2,6-diaminopimelate ligase